MELLAFFEWLDASWLAQISKAYGGVFAVVQMVHLLALALLGGAVLIADLRLLGVLLRDVPLTIVSAQTARGFDWALGLAVASGVFMTSAVPIKLYYNEMFWAKMVAFALGVVFVYAVRRPLLRYSDAGIEPDAQRLVAVASLVIWFSVAACGRWIGFS